MYLIEISNVNVIFLRKGRKGTTLIEAVLAIGVLSIISLGIYAGLTVGQQRTNDYRNLTEMAQIQDYLYSGLEAGTNSITNLLATTYYFDDEGLALSSGSGAWAYSAQMSLVSSSSGVALPNGAANTNLASVRIEVTAHSGATKTNYLYFVNP